MQCTEKGNFRQNTIKIPGAKLDVCGAEHTRLRSFCGIDTKILGKFKIQLPLNDQFFEVEALVVNEVPVDLILGQQSLQKFNHITFDFNNNIVLVNETSTITLPGPEIIKSLPSEGGTESDVEQEKKKLIDEDNRQHIKSLLKQVNKPRSRKARKQLPLQKQSQELVAYFDEIIINSETKEKQTNATSNGFTVMQYAQIENKNTNQS